MKYKCRLKSVLADLDIKLGEFADQIGIDKSTMSALVNNKSLPSFDTLYTIVEEMKKQDPNIQLSDIWVKIEKTPEDILNQDIDELKFDEGIIYKLRREGIETKGDLLSADITSIKGIGKVRLDLINQKITQIKNEMDEFNK